MSSPVVPPHEGCTTWAPALLWVDIVVVWLQLHICSFPHWLLKKSGVRLIGCFLSVLFTAVDLGLVQLIFHECACFLMLMIVCFILSGRCSRLQPRFGLPPCSG